MSATNCPHQNSERFPLARDRDARQKNSPAATNRSSHGEKLQKKTSSIVGVDTAGQQKRMGMGAQRVGRGVGTELENNWAAPTKDDRGGPFNPWQTVLEFSTNMSMKGYARILILCFHA